MKVRPHKVKLEHRHEGTAVDHAHEIPVNCL